MHTRAVLLFITHVRRTLCPRSWNVTRRRQEAEIFTTDRHRPVRMKLWRAGSMKERERGRSGRLSEKERERESGKGGERGGWLDYK